MSLFKFPMSFLDLSIVGGIAQISQGKNIILRENQNPSVFTEIFTHDMPKVAI